MIEDIVIEREPARISQNVHIYPSSAASVHDHRLCQALRNEGQRTDTHDYVVCLEFKRVRLSTFRTETFTIDEGAVGTLNVLDEDLP